MIEDKCDAVDLNLGCPQGIAKKGFYGSFLQDEWDLVYNMLSTLHINLRVPVCAKIRVFEDKQKTLAYAKHVCSAGVSILSVHGRTREMKGQWTGLADWDIIREIRKVIPRDVIMFANGNIQFNGDLERCLAFTGADGIMSAEGHLHNPAIFLDPKESMDRRNPRIDHLAREYLEIVKELKDPLSDVAVKAHLFSIFRVAVNGHTDIRNFLGTARGWEEMEKAISMFEERIEKELKENPEVEDGDIIPWYRCQPFLRPDPPPRPAKKQKQKHDVSSSDINTDVAVSV
jgi:tRNA-dihydrouridine synthase 1